MRVHAEAVAEGGKPQDTRQSNAHAQTKARSHSHSEMRVQLNQTLCKKLPGVCDHEHVTASTSDTRD